MKTSMGLVSLWGCLCLLVPTGARGQFQQIIDIELAPFEYSQTAADNRVSRLQAQFEESGFQSTLGSPQAQLRALLEALEISTASQVLVFSKTSLQVRYISSRNPRAIYFNDDTYVGWVHGSSLAEISTADPRLGTAFYTIELSPARPKLQQAYYDCLGCHATSMTQGIPGHTVRSVQSAWDGQVDPRRESYITDDRSPFAERWGGWYVTGSHGQLSHLGNSFLRGDRLDTRGNGNRADLRNDFDTTHYLTPYSDIVALMVLEHQTQMHNTLTRADFFVRQLLYAQRAQPASEQAALELRQQLQHIAQEVVDRLLFRDAAPWTSPVQGLTQFTDQFTARGLKDRQGRSLRDFNLQTRLFEYPCSYLIDSPTFDALQPELRIEIYRQLLGILTGASSGQALPADAYPLLLPEQRLAILEILRATRADWPD
jgi:hypothetical protein